MTGKQGAGMDIDIRRGLSEAWALAGDHWRTLLAYTMLGVAVPSLLLASERTGVAPERTVYVGDAFRDIEAGRAAGMVTIAVEYGYISDDDPQTWDADHVAADTTELTKILLKGFNLGN